jgi:hypothetical protein
VGENRIIRSFEVFRGSPNHEEMGGKMKMPVSPVAGFSISAINLWGLWKEGHLLTSQAIICFSGRTLPLGPKMYVQKYVYM